ncbi:MAG TPA: Fic family protein [Hyphomonadaceae bacterium]|nr:Fic family protein [Hyphomonadaceae bacterium]
MPESYAAADDAYCYPNSTVLRNLKDLRSSEELERFETAMASQRAEELLPAGQFDVEHYCAIHHHLFQDVYEWAGQPRTVRIEKGPSVFCYPENIEGQMNVLFSGLRERNFFRELPREPLVDALASFLATLNAIHPFREGNGRTGFCQLDCARSRSSAQP